MSDTVRYWRLANYSCPNHIICIVNDFTSLPKSASKTQRIQVGNGQYVSILFVIPIIVDMHMVIRFEVYTLLSEIHKNVDLVLGMKNVFELEVVINSWECCFSFLNRSIPLFPKKDKIVLKPKWAKIN